MKHRKSTMETRNLYGKHLFPLIPYLFPPFLLMHKHYIGDDFYPAIVDAATYKKANAELTARATTMGRLNKITVLPTKDAPVNFTMGEITNHFPDPLKHAEYLYSLIESEVI